MKAKKMTAKERKEIKEQTAKRLIAKMLSNKTVKENLF